MKNVFKRIFGAFLFVDLMLASVLQLIALLICWVMCKLDFDVIAYPFAAAYCIIWMHIYSVLDRYMGTSPEEVLSTLKSVGKCEPGDFGSQLFEKTYDLYKNIA